MSPEANQMEYHLKNFKATYIEVLQSNSDNLRTENVYAVRLKNAICAELECGDLFRIRGILCGSSFAYVFL